jgi:transcriptional regulator with XRE-family HTH domain
MSAHVTACASSSIADHAAGSGGAVDKKIGVIGMARKQQRTTENTKRPRDVDRDVGRKIRIYRLQLKMSQSQLAAGLGVTFQQVQKYEKGTNRVAPSRLSDIARILKAPVSAFFPDETDGARAIDPTRLDILTTARGQRVVDAWELLSATRRDLVVDMVEMLAGVKD